jgi:serine/threonine protein kinase
VFENLESDGYVIGVPEGEHLQSLYATNLKTAIEAIHTAGLVHMDLYPSNIMWKSDDSGNGVKIKIIDWDSVQLIGQPYSLAITQRLPMQTVEANVDWDMLHLNVILVGPY